VNLQKKHFKGNAERLQLFVDKFFHLNHRMQEFRHEEGIFMPDSMVIKQGGQEIEAFEVSEVQRAVECLGWVTDIMNGAQNDSVILVGHFTDNGRIHHAPFTKFVKTEEFGGEGANRINAGNRFEEEFFWSMQCKLDCLCKPNKYEAQVDTLLAEIQSKELKSDISLANVVWAGPANKRRTLVAGSPVAAVSSEGRTTKEIGSTLTDITAYFGGQRQNPVYISCKHGDTVTWINTGTGPLWNKADFDSFKGSNTSRGAGSFKGFGADFLAMFGLNQNYVAATFNNFPHTTPLPTISPPSTGPGRYNLNAIKGFLKYCVGYGYWMVHAFDNGTVDIYQMTQSYMDRVCNISGNSIKIQYGGVRGKGKRINILCSSSLYNFTFNIRGKQRNDIYPTHVMCDYKKKSQGSIPET